MKTLKTSSRLGGIVDLFGLLALKAQKVLTSGQAEDDQYDFVEDAGILPHGFKPQPTKSGPIPSRRTPQS
jgi:hypothetical protein